MRQQIKKISSIDKALAILSSFTPYNQEMGTIEISQKLGFHKATVSRILLNLSRHGFLKQDLHTKKFVLGPTIVRLSRAINQSLKNNMVHIAKPYVDALRNRLEESVILEVLSEKNTIIAYLAEGPEPVRLAGDIGDPLPIHAAAGAKAILAFSPREIRDIFLDGDMPPLTPNTITGREALQAQLEETRRQGVSFDNEEIDLGTRALGAPIFNHEEKPVAAVVVAGPSKRITWDSSSIVDQLKDTAAKISAELYYKLITQEP